ncbi:hypothetical protein GGI19_002195 [Coemansia pectinata]|uniref:Uncharacterized protein n=1 Tax=Coemansia pectinata TaxID=1052879 RepID=A0A9W8H051_9FUNG|nr:hypothetical protein GGI19_002195 [Coemansia pectinata]
MYSLYSWGSPFKAEGLYSFDPACISIQTYLQLSKAEWQLHNVSSTSVSPNNCLPALTCGQAVIESGFWRIVEFLKSEGYDLNAGLDEEQLSQSTAYISLVQDSLVDALLFSWYLVSENFVESIRPRLAKLFGFPLSLFIPTQLRDHAEHRLESRGIHSVVTTETNTASESSSSTNTTFLRSKIPRIYLLAKDGFKSHEDKSTNPVYAQAKKCLDVLSKKLDKKEYFFGAKPTALDTVVYGYLSPMLYPDLPQSTLKSMIVDEFPNLSEFCDRIHAQMEPPSMGPEQNWAAGVGSMVKQNVLQFASLRSYSLPSTQDDPELASKIISVAGALGVFFGYAIYKGILSVPGTRSKTSAELPSQVISTSDILSVVKGGSS